MKTTSFKYTTICYVVLTTLLFHGFYQAFYFISHTLDFQDDRVDDFKLELSDDFVDAQNISSNINITSNEVPIRNNQSVIVNEEGGGGGDEEPTKTMTTTMASPHVQNTSKALEPSSNQKLVLRALPVHVHVNVPGNLSNSTIYHCGYQDATTIYEHIYPELKEQIRNATRMNRRTAPQSTAKDVLLVGSGGFCGARPKLTTYWFEQKFKGTVIQINRENFVDENAWLNPTTTNASINTSTSTRTNTIPKKQYHLGHIADGCQSLRIFYMAQFFLLQKELWHLFLQETNKPVSTRERFLIYTAGNCVDFRQNAFDAIALANPSLDVEYAAGCFGNMQNLTNTVKYQPSTGGLYHDNWKFMRNFRFCLVMENSYVEGYVTEKILSAFAGGCIP